MSRPKDWKVPVHVLSGFLGTGKTTAVRDLLTRRGETERIALVINEFGDLGIDGPLLSDCSSCLLMEVPGGCVCCTAVEDLEASLEEISMLVAPDRIVIEPTGLACASDIVDLLRRPIWRERLEIRPVITFVDPQQNVRERYSRGGLFRDQIDAGDHIVINRCDLAQKEQIDGTEAFLRSLAPKKLSITRTSFGVLPSTVFETPGPVDTQLPELTSSLPVVDSGRGTRSSRIPGEKENYQGKGWAFLPERLFDDERLLSLFEALKAGLPGVGGRVARAKGIFKTTSGWKVYEVAASRIHQGTTAYRRDNRFDIILENGTPSDLAVIEGTLGGALIPETEALLSLETETGQIATVDRSKLREIAGIQGLVTQGRRSGIVLGHLLDWAPGEKEGAWLWLVSDGGFFGTGARRELLVEGTVWFENEGRWLTDEEGGPFLFELSEEAASGVEDEVDRCRSVPALCAIRLGALPGSRPVPALERVLPQEG